MRQTLEIVDSKRQMSLADLIRVDFSKTRLIGLFLAVLELIKLGSLVAVQEGHFGEILIVQPEALSGLRAA